MFRYQYFQGEALPQLDGCLLYTSTHKFGGSRERKDAIPERYKAGPISSVYVMQDEVSSLKKENSNQKTVIANQAARLNTLEAENERQRQELAETKQGLDDLRAVVNQLLAAKG